MSQAAETRIEHPLRRTLVLMDNILSFYRSEDLLPRCFSAGTAIVFCFLALAASPASF